MKVILLLDIARMGRKHDVKDVPDGHAHNYLIPRKLAVPATPEYLKRQQEHAARKEKMEAGGKELFAKFLAEAASTPIILNVPANEQGHLFKGLRAADIANAIREAGGFTLPASAIELDRPIKEVGEHAVTIMQGNKKGTVTITVTAA